MMLYFHNSIDTTIEIGYFILQTLRPLQKVTISVILEKDDGLFCSDWRKGAVFSQLISGGNRRPRFIGAMRRGQNSPINKLLKRPTREPRN